MNAHVHPLFAAAINPIARLPETTTRSLDEYVVALKTHDWHHAWSDDHSVFKKGSASADKLVALRKAVGDTSGAIWNLHAPDGYHIGRSA